MKKATLKEATLKKGNRPRNFINTKVENKLIGSYNESSMTLIVVIIKANQSCSLQVIKSYKVRNAGTGQTGQT